MENLTITTPTLQDKQAVLQFYHEFKAVHEVLHGANEFAHYIDDFAGWIDYINAPAGTQVFGYEKVPDSTFLAKIDDKVVGIMHIRHTLNDVLLKKGGHVGYSAHPDFAGRGIATALLAHAKTLLVQQGVDRVLVTCLDDNIGSQKVIIKNGGVLENTLDRIQRYWIAL